MEELTLTEVLNLKNMIRYHDMLYQKLNTYSSNCVDPQIKQILTKAAQDSLNTKQQLLTFFN